MSYLRAKAHNSDTHLYDHIIDILSSRHDDLQLHSEITWTIQ